MVLRHLIALLSLALGSPAIAACDAQAKYGFKFASQAAATLSYANSYTYAATNTLGQSSNITVGFQTFGLSSSVVGGRQMPEIGTFINNDNASNFLVLGGTLSARTANITANTNVLVMTVSFATPVRDVTISVSDIDFSNSQFRDWFYAVGRNGGSSYAPTIVTPYGQSNGGTLTNASSSLTLGPTGTPFAVGASEAVGLSANPNTAPGGDITLSFAQPVTSVELRYGNYPLQTLELATGQQAVGVGGISFCPMPVIQVSKTATPYVTAVSDPKRFATPGSDMVYALTVTNAGNSPVDLSTVVLTDPLPPQVTFYNGDVDDTGPLTTNFQFDAGSSGMTLASTNLGYSNNGGSSFTYTPATGYDPGVNALRFAPTGMLAANSSFTIKFRTRIN